MVADFYRHRIYSSTGFHGRWDPGDPRYGLGYAQEESSAGQ